MKETKLMLFQMVYLTLVSVKIYVHIYILYFPIIFDNCPIPAKAEW